MGRHAAPLPPDTDVVLARWAAEDSARIPLRTAGRAAAGTGVLVAERPPAPPVPSRTAIVTKAGVPAPRLPAPLPPEHRPIRAAGTPSTQPVPLQMPGFAAHGIATGPIPIADSSPAPRRGRLGVRVALGAAALVIVTGVVAQVTATRSDAAAGLLPFLGTGTSAATTSRTSTSIDASRTGSTSAAGSTSAGAATSASASASAATAGSASASASASRTRIVEPRPSRSSGSSRTTRPSRTASDPTSDDPSTGSVLPVVGRSLRDALGDGRNLAAGVFRFADFGSDLLGVDLTGRLTGAGSGDTVLEMTAGSSTKKTAVPTKAWTTNQLSLIRISQASVISGFTLQGTKQGHLYNGLRISRSTNPRISDVKVLSIPGNDDIPPGETFGINDFHTSGASYSDVEVDGSGVSGAAFGANNSNDVSISDSSFHDAGYSNGATFWQTKNVTVKDTTSVDNKDAAFNFERVSGTVLLDHVTMRGNGLSDLRINSDQASAVYRIVDPVLHGGKLKIVMTPKYMGHPNVQKKSDVHVIVNGVDRTADVVQWVDHF